ncbi:MAG: FHA domain-containing protein, partial [Micromonosporaceae bacterium]|nr:FHA domain-containing protein [Micromonosporaceae bacterium]
AASGNTINLVPKMLGPGPAAPAPVLGRRWRCPQNYCASFGDPAGNGDSGRERGGHRTQPPAQLRGGVPYCPRHGEQLTDLGPAPRAVALAVKVNDIVWHRFVLTEAAPVVVGRAPEDPGGVIIGLALDERGLRWVSRNHVQLELRGHRLQVTDISTNGTTLLRRTEPGEQPRRTPLEHGESAPIAEWDTVELYDGIELARAIRSAGPAPGAPTDSVMTDAPTTRIG